MYILDIIVKDWFVGLAVFWGITLLGFCVYLIWRLHLENQHKDKMDKLFAQYEEERGAMKYVGD